MKFSRHMVGGIMFGFGMGVMVTKGLYKMKPEVDDFGFVALLLIGVGGIILGLYGRRE